MWTEGPSGLEGPKEKTLDTETPSMDLMDRLTFPSQIFHKQKEAEVEQFQEN